MAALVAKESGAFSLKQRALVLRSLWVAVAILVVVAGAWGWRTGAFEALLTAARVQDLVAAAGIWGPLLIVALMTLAVVASPLPSAPIAVAAGALYGHTLGTVVVAAGAELGAIIAFLLARLLGHDVLRRWFGDRVDTGLMGSQNALMVTVFLSRLMPFVSFDMISYAAGLTRLRLWRFAIATLAGILPASFVLAHVGGELGGAGSARDMALVLGLGLVTGAPLIWVAWKRRDHGDMTAPVDRDQGGDHTGG